MLIIDGSLGEGGGQVLRTSLALSLCLGRPFRIEKIRAGRSRPGLGRQHLTAVRAAAAVGRAEVSGAELGSLAVTFQPHTLRPGDYHFDVGTSGSATLVLQTVLPALLTAPGPSTLTIQGGTHNPQAPPFEFIACTFLPLVNRMGPHVEAELLRHGFYPAGGGRLRVKVRPAARLKPLDIEERGGRPTLEARVLLAHLPEHVAQRELDTLQEILPLASGATSTLRPDSAGPGNVVLVFARSPGLTEVFTGFGRRGVRAESVARKVAAQVHRYLAAEVPVGAHLADQLLLPLALAGGGTFVTLPPSRHLTTSIDIIGRFISGPIACEQIEGDRWRVTVATPPA